LSKRRRQREVDIRSRSDDERMSHTGLQAAERLFARLAVRMLLQGDHALGRAGLRLHRRDGRELTPRESGPATCERERDYERSKGRIEEGPTE
jgi:hypothetical protein